LCVQSVQLNLMHQKTTKLPSNRAQASPAVLLRLESLRNSLPSNLYWRTFRYEIVPYRPERVFQL